MIIVKILLGFLLLLAGRKLFWLSVGAIGFLIGMQLAQRYLGIQSTWTVLAISLVAGLSGALLAVFMQNLAIGLGGFLIGGYLTTLLLGVLQFDIGGLAWVAFLAGGVVGVILLNILFDWGLIFLTSIIGASIVIGALDLGSLLQLVSFLVLFLAGLTVQWFWKRGERKPAVEGE